MKLWRSCNGTPGGKYLVTLLAPEGLQVPFPHIVWGGRDPAAPAGLRAYAAEARRHGFQEGPVGSTAREVALGSSARIYSVRRRDGSTPEWPYEVLLATDPCAPVALVAYAAAARAAGFDPDFVDDVLELSDTFRAYRARGSGGSFPALGHLTPVTTADARAQTRRDAEAYAREVEASADAFDDYRAAHGEGHPDAPPERPDDAAVASRLALGR